MITMCIGIRNGIINKFGTQLLLFVFTDCLRLDIMMGVIDSLVDLDYGDAEGV